MEPGRSIAPDICGGEMTFQCLHCLINQENSCDHSLGQEEVQGHRMGMRGTSFSSSFGTDLEKILSLFGLGLKFLEFLVAVTF